MRGGRGYNHRGSGPGRGSNSYGSRINSSARLSRYNNYNGGAGGNGAGSTSRYHSNYGASSSGPGNGGGGHYDSRNRDKFNNSNSSRYESAHKRNYRNSRDRSNDRKRSRQEEYRRNTSTGRNNRTPPPPPLISTPNTSNYRGGNNTSYRGSTVRSGDRHNSSNRNRSPMGQTSKRPVRASYMARQRGNANSSTRGLRTSIRGGGRIMRRESTDLRIMRRKLLYAQQKDRARVIKIARLTSSLRRRRLARRSNTPQHSNTDENGNKEDNDSNLKTKTSLKPSGNKRAKSSEKDEAENSNNDGGFDDDDDEINKTDVNTSVIRIKKGEESSAEADDTSDVNKDEVKGIDQEKGKDETEKDIKKEGKKKEDDGKKEKAIKSPTKKDADIKKKSDHRSDHEDGDNKNKKTRSSRRDNSDGRQTSRFIKLTCIHCHTKCVTFKEYSQHLYSRTHKAAIRQIALRQRSHLLRLRASQRTAQREIEENSKEEYDSKFCHLCRLHYRQPKAKHQLSEHHKTMKKFLMPYCSICHLAFKSPMLYETHRCSLEHIRNKARKNDSDSDNSADEMREIDLNKFLTVDSVGETDENEDSIDLENVANEADINAKKDGVGYHPQYIGSQYIHKMETYYCELCNLYTPTNKSFDDFASKHCKLRVHLKAFLRLKEEEKARKEDERLYKENTLTKENEDKVLQDDKNITIIDQEKKKDTDIINSDLDNSAEIVIDADDKLWEDVDKDLGDLLREVERDGEEDEDESVLNIDIESEKHNIKDINGLNEETKSQDDSKTVQVKPKLQRKTSNKTSVDEKENAQA